MGNENLNGQLSTRQLIKSLQAERQSEMLKQQQEVAARRLIISQRILGKWLQRDKSRAFQKWIQGTRYHVHLDLLNSHVLRMLKAILVRLCLKFKAQAFTTWFQATVKVSRRVTIKSHNQRTAVRVTIVRLFMKFLALAFSRWRSRAYTKHLRDGRAARGRRQLRKRILRRSYTLRSQAWQTWCNWMSTASHVCYRDTWKRRLVRYMRSRRKSVLLSRALVIWRKWLHLFHLTHAHGTHVRRVLTVIILRLSKMQMSQALVVWRIRLHSYHLAHAHQSHVRRIMTSIILRMSKLRTSMALVIWRKWLHSYHLAHAHHKHSKQSMSAIVLRFSKMSLSRSFKSWAQASHAHALVEANRSKSVKLISRCTFGAEWRSMTLALVRWRLACNLNKHETLRQAAGMNMLQIMSYRSRRRKLLRCLSRWNMAACELVESDKKVQRGPTTNLHSSFDHLAPCVRTCSHSPSHTPRMLGEFRQYEGYWSDAGGRFAWLPCADGIPCAIGPIVTIFWLASKP